MSRGDPPVVGYLVHVYHRPLRGVAAICGVGRLAGGGTFAFIDSREQPHFYLRASEADWLAPTLRQGAGVWAPTELRTMDGEPVVRVSAVSVASLARLAEAAQRQGGRTYEADVPFSRGYLIERGLSGGVSVRGPWRPGSSIDRVYREPQLSPTDWEPQLGVLALDIETDPDASQVLAVSLVECSAADARALGEEVHVVGVANPADPAAVTCHVDESALLRAVVARVRQLDPDIITGWNVVDFDLAVLARRCAAHGLAFNLGRTADVSTCRAGETWGRSRVEVHGRQVLDAMHLVRSGAGRFADYRLATVAQALLGRGKTIEGDPGPGQAEAILRAYHTDRAAFCAYCLEDSRLVRDILAHEDLIKLSLRRSMLTGLPLDRAWASVAALDYLYIGALRLRQMVAPSLGVDRCGVSHSPGGLVLAPRAGLYRHVLVFDFRSLYPSVIRTFNIDPWALVQGRTRGAASAVAGGVPAGNDSLLVAPNGAAFVRAEGILPQLLERFFARRQQAREAGDELASHAYKIVMNSFYGCLGTPSCRFAEDDLAGAVTAFGQYLLRWATQLLEGRQAATVLYGDTDSLFVDVGLDADLPLDDALARGQRLCAWVNAELADHVARTYGVRSHLLLEFKKYYRRFLLPPMRGGGERGRAKGYAGRRLDHGIDTVEIVGMEAVRHDWTELAHAVQRDLLGLLFDDAPPSRLQQQASWWVDRVRTGGCDAQLVYRKGLRRPLTRYRGGAPPHVVAARRLSNPGSVVEYLMTVDGPQPVGYVSARPDYDHYVARQILPIVRTIAQVCPLDLSSAMGGPADLFAAP